MHLWIFYVVFFLLLHSSSFANEICSDVILSGTTVPSFTKDELRFICGDKDSVTWSVLPVFHVKKTLQAILQGKGYHHPVFREEDDKLRVLVGKQTLIRSIELNTDTPIQFEERPSKKIGTPLTPDSLNEIEVWYKSALSSKGIPCPRIRVRADSRTGSILLDGDNIRPTKFLETREDLNTGLARGVMERYYAFDRLDVFDGRLLEITSERIVSDGIADDNRYSIECRENGFIAHQRVTVGPPRLFTVGFGANTEKGPIGKISWSTSRLGENGSSLSVSLTGSYREQFINLYSRWRAFQPTSRFLFRPELEVKRTLEKQYETIDGTAKLFLGTSFDAKGFGGLIYVGPSFNYSNLVEGAGPQTFLFLSLDSITTLSSHLYEYFRNSPREGWSMRFETSFIQNNLGSRVSGYFLKIEPRVLINIGNSDPPFLIFNVRGTLATTLTSSDNSLQALPVAYRHYLGGMEDLRGFGRKEIPIEAKGVLTTGYLGFELRSNSLIHDKLQPLIFLDLGFAGEKSIELEPSVYWSPGFGLRWESPVGNFRGTLAHGYVTRRSSEDRERLMHWQGYLSYGQEF